MDMKVIPIGQATLKVFTGLLRPKERGYYLLLCFEWVGLKSSKPKHPTWKIAGWDGKNWDRKVYTFDTGGYEEFEAVAWCELPSVEWT